MSQVSVSQIYAKDGSPHTSGASKGKVAESNFFSRTNYLGVPKLVSEPLTKQSPSCGNNVSGLSWFIDNGREYWGLKSLLQIEGIIADLSIVAIKRIGQI